MKNYYHKNIGYTLNSTYTVKNLLSSKLDTYYWDKYFYSGLQMKTLPLNVYISSHMNQSICTYLQFTYIFVYVHFFEYVIIIVFFLNTYVCIFNKELLWSCDNKYILLRYLCHVYFIVPAQRCLISPIP